MGASVESRAPSVVTLTDFFICCHGELTAGGSATSDVCSIMRTHESTSSRLEVDAQLLSVLTDGVKEPPRARGRDGKTSSDTGGGSGGGEEDEPIDDRDSGAEITDEEEET